MRSMLVAAVLTALGLTSRAAAEITAFWQRATITPAAISEEPALANMQTWDLLATTTGNWQSAGLWAQLPASSTYYKHPLAALTRPDPALFGSSPAVEFTTFVSAANDNGTNHTTVVLGAHVIGPPPSLGDPSSPIPGLFTIDWGNSPATAPAGTYQIARLTFPQGVFPMIPILSYSFTQQVNPDANVLIPAIPEAQLCGLVAIIVPLLVRRRLPFEDNPEI